MTEENRMGNETLWQDIIILLVMRNRQNRLHGLLKEDRFPTEEEEEEYG
jgi:hypothetical protein